MFAIVLLLCCVVLKVFGSENLIKIDKVLQGKSFNLHLLADVYAPPVGTPVNIYRSTFATADKNEFKKLVFGTDAKVKDDWAEKKPEQLEE